MFFYCPSLVLDGIMAVAANTHAVSSVKYVVLLSVICGMLLFDCHVR